MYITSVRSFDARYPLPKGAGTDAVHSEPVYAFAVSIIETDTKLRGCGLVLTLGEGNQVVCQLIDLLARELVGKEIEILMDNWGAASWKIANHPQLRWLGPHKGAVCLALASLTNAVFDLWAKARGVPLWRLLLDLEPEKLVRLLDLHGLEDVLAAEDALKLIKEQQSSRRDREQILKRGYPGYDTSVGWFAYKDECVRENARRALDRGFCAFKLKVGSEDLKRDIRRAKMLREITGSDSLVMLDANQQWTLSQAIEVSRAVQEVRPYWLEEPIHPDDILGHQRLADRIAPVRIALGEHVPNRVMFKNFMQAQAVHFVQADCTRVAGISEFLTVSLLARKFDLPVVPHAGDMGQIHQHLVLFNHIAYKLPIEFLEYIPHLSSHFVHPARVEGGMYRTPQEPGCSCELLDLGPGSV